MAVDRARREWATAKDGLVVTMIDLGFPEEFGTEIAKGLGSPQAIRRMRYYLKKARPDSPETIVDEMIAIRIEIDAWKRKKEGEEANSRYNEILRYGLDEGPRCRSHADFRAYN